MEACGGIPEQGYGEFSDWLHRRAGDQRIPLSGSLEVTLRCNLRCQHCYIPPGQRAAHSAPELTLAETQRILDEVTDAGCLWLLLTGGEPFLRPDFREIYAYARRKGLLLTVFSNGTLVTPEIADFLADWRPFKMEITLYGATQETYERVTGIPGSYARCRRGIDLLVERRLPLSLKTMLMTLNARELGAMQDLAASLGVEFKYDPMIHPALDQSRRPLRLRLSPEEVLAVEKDDPRRASRWPEEFSKRAVLPASDRRMYLCNAGKQGFHIDAAGRLSICLTARQPYYDLRGGSFREGWQNFIPQVISRQYNAGFPCLGCDLRTVCAQCPAVAELELDNDESRVAHLCQVAKLRHQAFGQPTG